MACASVHTAPAARATDSSAPLVVTDASLEWLKWIAVAAMVLDHINWFWFAAGGSPRSTGHAWMNEAGRVALPLFAFAFGLNLHRVLADAHSAARLRRMGLRLGLAGVIAQCLYWPLRGYFFPLNVMFLFAIALGACVLYERGERLNSRTWQGVTLAVALVGGFVVEYWWFGLMVVFSAYAWAARPTTTRLAALVLSVILLAILNNSPWPLAALPIVYCLARATLAPRRIPGLLHAFYPAHLAALLVASLAFGRLA